MPTNSRALVRDLTTGLESKLRPRAMDKPIRVAVTTSQTIMATNEHQHPGVGEPRSYGRTHHENLNINLNSASEQELADLPMVGPEKAQALISARPIRTWDDVKKIPGFSSGMVDDLKSGGVRVERSD